jgi:methyl-accepting chemotaxis protein
LVDAPEVTIKTADVYAAAGDTTQAFRNLSAKTYGLMRARVQERLRVARQEQLIHGSVVLAALLLALTLSWLITRSLTRPMSQAIQVFDGIAAGSYDNEITVAGVDEASQVLRSLSAMQVQLKKQIESERAAADYTARVKSALDVTSARMMLADENLTIVYLNGGATELFTSAAEDFRRDVPALDPTRIIGSSIDVFHRDPSKQRRLLESMKKPYEGNLKIGNHSMRVVATPVFAEGGKRVGTVMEWFDRTEEVRAEQEIGDIVSKALTGDLITRISTERKTGFFLVLANGLNELLENMSSMVRDIMKSAGEVNHGAAEISAGVSNLSSRTEQQSSSLEETASAMEEMTSTVRQNADNAAQANQLASAARDQAEGGRAVVGQAVTAMREINASSKRIAEIISVIDEIAFQTNLLALNAAVEAARAGEDGRGFAVVATEVRDLAGRSAGAAKEIKALIQDSVDKVGQGSRLVDESGETLAGIVASVKKVTDIVAEIAAASREQASGIEQVNNAVTHMDQMTQENASLVAEASSASSAMAGEARNLNDMMARFRVSSADADRGRSVERKEPSRGDDVPPARDGVQRRRA